MITLMLICRISTVFNSTSNATSLLMHVRVLAINLAINHRFIDLVQIMYVNNIYAGKLSQDPNSTVLSSADFRHITIKCTLDALLTSSTFGYKIDVYSTSVFVLVGSGSFTANSYFVRNVSTCAYAVYVN